MIAVPCVAVMDLGFWSIKFHSSYDTICFVADSILLEGRIRAMLYKQQELVFKKSHLCLNITNVCGLYSCETKNMCTCKFAQVGTLRSLLADAGEVELKPWKIVRVSCDRAEHDAVALSL